MNLKLLFSVLKNELVSSKAILPLIALSLSFIFISLVIINLKTIISIFQNTYPFLTKFYISLIIILGTFSATSSLDIVLLILMGVLFGINMTLVINKFNMLKRRGNLRIMMGTGIISVFAAGCASCGLSFASLIGISAALALLPFGGIELYFVAILILLTSVYFNLKQIIKVCKIQ